MLTPDATMEKEPNGNSYPGSGNAITLWSHHSKKLFHLQLCMDYHCQIWTTFESIEEESIGNSSQMLLA